ncbi:UDP-N-acetylglucosamine 2-epimerase (non-hydrolyzing) [Candidatus Sumerlaeota bacterium]|nr:UDP-N-acetylglucosamine 2-epimerase (non-hydrolyzing) [Candidatus Sumerlaeota bacterium]
MKKKLLFIFGTRPEAIKLAPVIHQAKKYPDKFIVRIVVTAQHREMLDDVLDIFKIMPDYDFDIMTPDQSLFFITHRIFKEMEGLIKAEEPDILIVQGDTTTTFAGALCGYYAQKKVAHVEAGLRTGNKYSPFPEELYRKMTSALVDFHFAPTEWAKNNLLNEGYPEKNIYVTGNTVIDALFFARKKIDPAECPINELRGQIDRFKRMILITGHRRENFGEPLRQICEAFRQLALSNPDVCFVYSVHLNPNVQKPVKEILSELPNFFLIAPQPYLSFVWLMNHSYFIITDSGGIQEEAPSLGKPVLVTRQYTERPEGIQAGILRLVGIKKEDIIEQAQQLLDVNELYQQMSKAANPYGDGKAAQRIISVLARE